MSLSPRRRFPLSLPPDRGGSTITGQSQERISFAETAPGNSSRSGPWPREPANTRSETPHASISLAAGSPSSRSISASTCSDAHPACSSSRARCPRRAGAAGGRPPRSPVGARRTCSRSDAAAASAASDSGEPSKAATMRKKGLGRALGEAFVAPRRPGRPAPDSSSSPVLPMMIRPARCLWLEPTARPSQFCSQREPAERGRRKYRGADHRLARRARAPRAGTKRQRLIEHRWLCSRRLLLDLALLRGPLALRARRRGRAAGRRLSPAMATGEGDGVVAAFAAVHSYEDSTFEQHLTALL